ncbi:MAG: GRP family sugar transporter [Weissella confusa]
MSCFGISALGLTHVLSGIAWAAGTSFQLAAFKKMGVSQASGLNTAGQIAVNALVGAAVFGEWTGAHQWTIGLLAIASVIIGVFLISGKPSNLNKDGVRLTAISENLCLPSMVYFMIPKTVAILDLVHVNTGTLHNTMALSLPIAIGQTIGALVFGIIIFNGGNLSLPLLTKETAKNGIAGVMWGTGEVMIRLAVLNPAVGQAKASTLSQMGIIVSTMGAIIILKERKTKRQIIGIGIVSQF